MLTFETKLDQLDKKHVEIKKIRENTEKVEDLMKLGKVVEYMMHLNIFQQ